MTSQIIDSGLRHVLDAISDGVYVTTADREIVYWSAGAERITGYRADEVLGRRCHDNVLVHTDLRGNQLCFGSCPLEECIRSGEERAAGEVFLKRKDGERLAVYVKTAIFEVGGERFGVEIFGELETLVGKQLAAQVQELSDSAITDPLTGLFNRRYLDAALAQQFAMFRRLGRRYGVIYVDIDDFKEVNDVLGHEVGDDALRFVAEILSDNVRKMDVAARYGGDEFVVICSLATDDDLRRYGRRLTRLIGDSRFAPAEDEGLRITVSAGGALVGVTDEDERQAVDLADRALFKAKEAGRDGFAVLAPEDTS